MEIPANRLVSPVEIFLASVVLKHSHDGNEDLIQNEFETTFGSAAFYPVDWSISFNG